MKKTKTLYFLFSYFFSVYKETRWVPWETDQGSKRRVIFYNDVLMAEGRLSSATYPYAGV